MKILIFLSLIPMCSCISTHRIRTVNVAESSGEPISGARVEFGSTASGHQVIDLSAGPTKENGGFKLDQNFYVNKYSTVRVIKNEKSAFLSFSDFEFVRPNELLLRVTPKISTNPTKLQNKSQ